MESFVLVPDRAFQELAERRRRHLADHDGTAARTGWEIDDPAQKQPQALSFYRNIQIFGTSLMMFGLFSSAGAGVRFTLTGPLPRW